MGLDRIVLWGPAEPDPGVSGGNGNVFVSDLGVRVLRMLRDVRIPGTELSSLCQLDYDLKMYAGSESDYRAYSAVR